MRASSLSHRSVTESAMSSFKSLVFLRRILASTFLRHNTYKSALTIFLPIAAMLALSGCAGLQLKLGMKVNLEKIPIASIQASQPNGAGIAPGDKSPLVVTIIEPDGKTLVTEGKGKGKVRWQDLTVASTVASATKKGVLTLPRDPRISDGQLPHVTVTVPSHPDVRAELDVPLRYDRNYKASFSSASGSPNGSDGSNGSDGRSGFTGSSGKGGPIFVTYDPRAKSYLEAIQLRNPGGPSPIVKEAPVGPLW